MPERYTPKYTKMEQVIMSILADGHAHLRDELHSQIDTDAEKSRVGQLVVSIRKKLPPSEAVICEYANRRIHYRHVRLIGSAIDY